MTELNSKTPEEIWIPCACMDGFMCMGPEAVGRGFVNTNQKVALKLLPVSGPERMPHCSFLKKLEF